MLMLALYSVSVRCGVNAVSMLSHSLYPGCFGIAGLAVKQSEEACKKEGNFSCIPNSKLTTPLLIGYSLFQGSLVTTIFVTDLVHANVTFASCYCLSF